MWSNCLEAKLGLGLHRPKVAPHKSLVWQVRAAAGQGVGGRMFPSWGQGRRAQGGVLRSEERRS